MARAWACLVIMAVVVSFAILESQSAAPAARSAKQRDEVQISISRTLFNGVSDRLALSVLKPFGGLMQTQTGLAGEVSISEDPFKLGEQLVKDDVQIGVFEGIEFAWVHEKHPELELLAVAVNQEKVLRACLVVDDDFTKDVKDLRGKSLAMPAFSRRHCRLFIDELCQEQGGANAHAFFQKIITPESVDEALDDIVDGKIDAAVVDNLSLETFKRQKPGRFGQLKVLKQSGDFPASPVVFCKGQFDEETVRKFRQGLLNANQSPLGRHLLTLWKLTAFEAAPKDYQAMLTRASKHYPAPKTR